MAVEPEDVLPEDGRTAGGWIKEAAAKVAIHKEHDQCAREHWRPHQDEDACDDDRPHHDRHAEERHARSAHAEDRHEEVHRTKNGTRANEDNGHDPQIHPRARAIRDAAEWWVGGPPCVSRTAQEES